MPPFALERYFAQWEFVAPYLLCSSDIEGWRMADLLALADDEGRERWERLSLGYTEYPGLPALREAITTLYTSVTPDEVLTFAGASEAIFAFMQTALRPGDHVVAWWPGYQSLYAVARAIGAEVTLLPLRDEDGWAVDLDALRRALRPTTKLIVLNAPHNPTGATLAPLTFHAIAGLAAEAGAWLFSDEVYRLMEHDPADQLPAGVDLGPHVVSLGVMSKAFGLAGLRVGWLAVRDAGLRDRLATFKDYLSMCNSGPSEVLALIALRARERVLARSHTLIQANLVLLDAFFERHATQISWVRPKASCVGFPRLLAEPSADAFVAALVHAEGVLLLPASVYGVQEEHVRLGFGRTTMAAALERLERFLGCRATR
jgi:aspartate/methionine/tyrosine aminotransferase